MEGVPKNTTPGVERAHNDVENLSDWRERREQAPQAAEKWIDTIDNFENLPPGEQVLTLNVLKEQLAEDNKNLYIDRVVAQRVADIIETMPDEERAEYKLPLRSPAERHSESNVVPFPVTPPPDYTDRLGYAPKPSNNPQMVGAEQREVA